MFEEEAYMNLHRVNDISFTKREIDIISCILNNRGEKKIASILDISPHTVSTHVRNILGKVGANSKEYIIDFIHKSGKKRIFFAHYEYLFQFYLFTQTLPNIKKEIQNQKIYLPNGKNKNQKIILNEINANLKHIGIEILKKPQAKKQICFYDNKISPKDIDPNIIYIATKPIADLSSKLAIVDFSSKKLFPKAFLELICLLFPSNKNLSKIVSDFKNQFSSTDNNISLEVSKQEIYNSSPNNKKYFKILFLAATLLFAGLYIINNFLVSNKNKEVIRSDLIIPLKSALLERPNIIKEIDDRLKEKEGIKTIALTGIIGMGGAGKTTMARYYGSLIEDASVIWELNSETKDSLLHSFHELAYSLTAEKTDRELLGSIEQIKNSEIQEKQLLNFVKSKLKTKSSWLLIYDNLESLSKIMHLFPNNSNEWGNGRIIITTRNEHIAETSYIDPDDVIHIDELNDQEMLMLFSKILYGKDPMNLGKDDYKKVKEFLKNIPAFPLDVSVAAYSIKNTHVTFEQYLKHIGEYTSSYDNMQTSLLKEVSNYGNTRYGIVSSALDKLSKLDKNFPSLFFMVSTLDSQNISYELLEQYNQEGDTEYFIYNLRKNGLLLRESYSDFAKENKVISIHRSTQEIGNLFFINTLKEKQLEFYIQNIVEALEKYYKLKVLQKNNNKILSLIPHLKSIINTIENTKIQNKEKYLARLNFLLGQISYKWERNFLQARNYFKVALIYNSKSKTFSNSMLAILLKDLATASATANHIAEAINYSNQSIKTLQKIPNTELIIVDNLQILGELARKTNSFDQAKDYFHRALSIIPKSDDIKIRELKAEIYTKLANLYFSQYMSKKAGAIANDYGIKALKILGGYKIFDQDSILPEYITCNVARQQWKYSQVFSYHFLNFTTAKKWVKSAEYIMQKKCPNNLYLKGRLFGSLSEILLRENNPVGAEQLATETVDIIGFVLGPRSGWSSRIIRSEAKIRMGKFHDVYNDLLVVINLPEVEKNNLHDLRRYTAYYHAAFVKYKLKDYQKSLELFKYFVKNMQDFCKDFLDEEEYLNLLSQKVFEVQEAGNDIKKIKLFVQNASKIFKVIYTENHPFVTDYILQNF